MDFTTASRKIKECVRDLKILHDDPMKGVWMASFRAFFDKWYSFFKPAWPKRLVARVSKRQFDDEPEDPAGTNMFLLVPAYFFPLAIIMMLLLLLLLLLLFLSLLLLLILLLLLLFLLQLLLL